MAERWQDYAVTGLVLGLPLSSVALSAALQLIRPVAFVPLEPVSVRLVRPLPGTIKLKVPPPKPSTVIEAYDLPDELAEGEWVTGKVTAHNAGDVTGVARVFLHTVWDGKWYTHAPTSLDPCARLIVNIPSGLIKMPDQDATIEMYGTHENPAGEIHTADCRYWKIDDKEVH